MTMQIHWIMAHAIGDFLLQNDWMQRKTTSTFHAVVHAACYLAPFLLTNLAWWQIALIGVQHCVQDRMGWARIWQRFVRQTPPDKWPTGTLLVDQTLHVVFMAWVGTLA